VVGLFSADTSEENLKQLLAENLPDLPLASCLLSRLEDQDWERAWLDDYKPMCFGDTLWVCPSGMQINTGEGSGRQVIMELDPGLAFGTGTHPTTAMCLEWLATADLAGRHVIDYGCGSGILGIAALLLGADSVSGVDNDPQALTATHDNCDKNTLAHERFPVYLPKDFANALADGSQAAADIVLANILAGPLVSLAPYLAAMVRPQGTILLSGILREQAEEVMAAYAPWFDLAEPVYQGDWTRLEGKRDSQH